MKRSHLLPWLNYGKTPKIKKPRKESEPTPFCRDCNTRKDVLIWLGPGRVWSCNPCVEKRVSDGKGS